MSYATKRRLGNLALDALTWLVLLVMLAPVFWLLASSTQTTGRLADGTYDLLDPTFDAFGEMWQTVNFDRYFLNSLLVCGVASVVATAFAASAGYALARYKFRGSGVFSTALVGTQLIPGSMFLLPVFLGFIWLKQNTPIALFDTQLGLILV